MANAFPGNQDGWYPAWSPDGVNMATGTYHIYVSNVLCRIGDLPKWANTTHVVCNDHDAFGVFIIDATDPANPVIPTTDVSGVGANNLAAGGDRYVIFTTNPGGQGTLYPSWTTPIPTGCNPEMSANGQFAYIAPYQGLENRQIFINNNPTPLDTGNIRDCAVSNNWVAWIRDDVLFCQPLVGTHVPTKVLGLSTQDFNLLLMEAANTRPYIALATNIGVDVFAANSTQGWRIDSGGSSYYPGAVMVGNTVNLGYSSAQGSLTTLTIDVTSSTNASMLQRPGRPVVNLIASSNEAVATNQIIAGTQEIDTPHTYGTSYLRISDAFGNPEISGIAGGSIGRQYVVNNGSGSPVLMLQESGLSVGANRLNLTTGADTPLSPKATMSFHYDPFVQRWVQG